MVLIAGNRQISPFQGEVLLPSTPSEERKLQRAAKEGKITRIAKGVYINAIDPVDQDPGTHGQVAMLVRRNWQRIVGHLFPGAVVTHRSALCAGMTPDHEVILSHSTRYNATTKLPGLTIVLMKGPGPLPGDLALSDSGLYWSSRPRMLLENLTKSRGNKRSVGKAGVEEKLVHVLNASGEDALNRLREDARMLTPHLDADFDTLNALIGALLGTYAKGTLTTRAGMLVANGTPVDSERIARLGVLADALRTTPVPAYPDVAGQDPSRTNAAFLESYFSNFVEGTRFSIEEAEGIALHNKIVPNRPKDSHDIIGVFKLALHPYYRSSLPAPMDVLDGLRERHRFMLKRRPEATPGEFKEQNNFAGQTRFVESGLVRGTLLEGVKLASSVPEGMARAIFYAFLVSEIHPFSDGNGRLSRLMMNAELSRLGLCRIIIPTLFHEQYVDAQRALTRRNDPDPIIRALGKIARWGSLFDYKDLHQVVASMRAANAFEEDPREFKLMAPDGSVFA